MTTSWIPDLDEVRGPLYWRIAAALARDVHAGRLGFGEKLPTHRALADELGVTVGTVTKAYAEAERSGLVVSRTGRGTYIKGFPEDVADDSPGEQNTINLSENIANLQPFSAVFNKLLNALSRRGSLHILMEFHPHPGLDRHRAAGAKWVGRRGIDTRPEQIIVCNGAQEALLATLSTIARPRDTVITEKLNYAGVQRIAEILNLNLRGVESDDKGIIPEALEEACKKEAVSAILTTPTNHNPTNAMTPLDRRKAIVDIAGRTGVIIVEDDIFGHMAGLGVTTLTELAPDRCIYVCGLSKCIAPGLRIGYISAPPALVNPILGGLRALSWISPALMAEIATLLIEQGHADEFVDWHRNEALARNRLAREILGMDVEDAIPSYHLWLPLPEPWKASAFTAALRSQGVFVSPSDQFAFDHRPVPDAIRISYGSVQDDKVLREGLRLIADSLSGRSNRIQSPG